MTRKAKIFWLVGGTLVSALLGATFNSFSPVPRSLLWVALSVGDAYVYVFPLLYLVTLAVLMETRWLEGWVVLLALAFALLSLAYFLEAWPHGIRWQGRSYTLSVILGNALGIGILLSLTYLGKRRRNRTYFVSAYAFLFAMLSWSAFPYLGEPI